LRTPPALAGPTPKVGFGYSAQGVDGFTAASNAQPSEIGEGFGWHPGFIDRGYRACLDDGQAGVGDLCWAGDNAVLSLNGRSSQLVFDAGSGLWRPSADDGSRVERLTGAGNGDNDGEHWKVTTTDGTQYFFGLNRLPGWRSGTDPETRSVSYVPVFGNQSGEPCHGASFAASSCQQAYRWSLDYVVDPRGNTMSYFYDRDVNRYARNVTATDTPEYVRTSRVREIAYGTRQDSGADSVFVGTAPSRVLFSYVGRCITAGATCVESNPANYPDVPLDQACGGGNCAGRYSPTFWTTQKLAEVRTQVASGAKLWRDVDRWRLTQELKDPGDGQAKILWLKQVQHCGLVGGELCLPPVTFNPVQMSNRVDRAGSTSSIIRYRIRSITSESGGVTTLSYSDPECAAGTNMPASADQNTKRCFPVFWLPPGAASPRFEYFHKYVVTQVTETDLTGASPDQVTSYQYGPPAWHYDENALTLPTRRSWNQWRGYGTVTETHGPNDSARSRTEFRYFRGMNGDRLASGTRSASLTDSDGGTWTDHNWLAGQLREQITYLGPTTTVVDKTLKDPYQFGPTASQTLFGTTVEARVVSTAVTTVKTALDAGRGWRTTRTTNVFTPDRSGRLDRVDNEGDTATPADDQCTRFTYATNAAGTMLNSLARVESVAVACAATPNRATDVISDVRMLYDGAGSFGTTLTRGLSTRVEKLADWNGGDPVYVTEVRMAYDIHGRPVEETDALGRKTTTVYTPATGGPVTRTSVNNPMGWPTVTDLDPAWGVPTGTTDPNMLRTVRAYDPMGRLTALWRPGRQSPALPDVAFEYLVRNGAPTVVTAKRLNPSGTAHIASYTVYDGLTRERQKQVPAVGGGRIITETTYDSRGLVQKLRPEYFNSASPAPSLFVPTGDTAVPAQTVNTYDGAERVVAEVFQIDGASMWQTKTNYFGDHISVEPPAGATATVTWTDARDRISRTWQYHGNVASGDHDETVRTYTKAGDLASLRDASGTTWRYAYDQRRRKVRDEDPDKGIVTYTYDNANRPSTMTDARAVTVAFAYDALDRRTATHLGSTSGRKLTSWVYDTLAKGPLTSSTRFDDAGNAYLSEVTQYNARYQPLGTKTTIPAVEGVLAGEYTTSQTYNVDGSVATQTEPAKTGASSFGGLTAETLTYGYNSLGLPTTVSGQNTYVTETLYRQDGKLAKITSSGGPGKNVVQYWAYQHGTGRLAERQVLADTAQVVAADIFYAHDPAGNVTSIADRTARFGAGPDDTQCFAYDHRQRLTTAWTPAAGDCAASPTVSGLGGPAPYLRSYTYTPNGNRLSETEHRAGGNITKSLTYPTAARPHAVSTVTTTAPTTTTTDTYAYDAVGNTTKRPGASGEQTLAWDAEGRMSTITENGATASFVYDADGGRLVQRDPAGRTLSLNGVQYRAASGGAVAANRRYGHAVAGLVASRDGVSGLYWQAADHQGSIEYAFKASDLAATRRRFAPFGLQRSPATWPNPYGYVGGEHDTAGTVHLGAREYDASIGRFLSVDPIMDVSDPQSWQGYAYADNTPVTASDPDGLRPCIDACGSKAEVEMAEIERQRRNAQATTTPSKKPGNGCPRQLSREDCRQWSSAAPQPRQITSVHTYPNGTQLVVYSDGTYEINGYRLPPGHPDPGQLATAVDRMGKRGKHDDTDHAWAISSVKAGCGMLASMKLHETMQTNPGGVPVGMCSSNFLRAVEKDLDEAEFTYDEWSLEQKFWANVDAAGNAVGNCSAFRGPAVNCTGQARQIGSFVGQVAWGMFNPKAFCHGPGLVHGGLAIAGLFAGPLAPAFVGIDAYCHLTE